MLGQHFRAERGHPRRHVGVVRIQEGGDRIDVGSHGNFGSRFSVNAWYPSM